MELSGNLEDQPSSNELLLSSTTKSERCDLDYADEDIRLYKQQGSHCVLYSVINCLQQEEKIRKFLKLGVNEDINDITNYEDWMVTNRASHAAEYNNKKNHEPFYQGVTSLDMKAYLGHLKEEGIVSSFTFTDQTRIKTLEHFSFPHRRKVNENYLLMGYTSTSDRREAVSRNFIDEVAIDSDGTETNSSKQEKKNYRVVKRFNWERHRNFSKRILNHFSPVETSIDKETDEKRTRLRTSAEMSSERKKAYQILGTINLHAVGIKFNKKGVPYILETGRKTPHRLINDSTTNNVLKEISFSLPVLYKIYYLKIHFS
jgi:hypothetical protein